MTARTLTVGIASALFVTLTGCGDGRVKVQDVEVKAPASAIDQAVNFLDRYAKGQPMGSEATQFEDILSQIRNTDSKKAEMLEKGFNEMKTASRDQLKAKATALIKQIAPDRAQPK